MSIINWLRPESEKNWVEADGAQLLLVLGLSQRPQKIILQQPMPQESIELFQRPRNSFGAA